MAKRTNIATMWFTRRWATDGIFHVTGTVDSRGHFASKEAPYVSGIVGVEFFRAWGKAVARAREKKRALIKSLQKRATDLRAMKFDKNTGKLVPRKSKKVIPKKAPFEFNRNKVLLVATAEAVIPETVVPPVSTPEAITLFIYSKFLHTKYREVEEKAERELENIEKGTLPLKRSLLVLDGRALDYPCLAEASMCSLDLRTFDRMRVILVITDQQLAQRRLWVHPDQAKAISMLDKYLP